MECRAASIPSRGGARGQCMGSVLTQQRKEFRQLLLCCGNSGLGSQQQLGETDCDIIPKMCENKWT